MQQDNRWAKKVAVLGAGVMGTQIAAHLANAGIPVTLYELTANDTAPNAHVEKALKTIQKIKPPAFASPQTINYLTPANYDQHLGELQTCDLVIEAISERLDWKHALYERILPHLNKNAILATNTSGIPLSVLGKPLSTEQQSRFCGIHFFNPPRYMTLVELIPHSETSPSVLHRLEGFLTSALGKGVIHVKDTPGFIANRIGVFSILTVMHHATRLGLPLDLVDKLTGSGIGRPKSATLRTADVVGLDTFQHVVNNLQLTLTDDPWRDFYVLPPWLTTLIEKGALGQKSGAGIYRKNKQGIQVIDLESEDYRPVCSALDDDIRAILNNPNPAEKYAALRQKDHPQATFLLAVFYDLFHYCAVHAAEISHHVRDIDLALRWGYGWQMGPFEIWQAIGWQRISQDLHEAIQQQHTMSQHPLPDWVKDSQRTAVYTKDGAYSPATDQYCQRSTHPIYQRQLFPERLPMEISATRHIIREGDYSTLWHSGDDFAILSFKTKMHTVNMGVLEAILDAVKEAENHYKALIIWQDDSPFCAGANLLQVINAIEKDDFDSLAHVVRTFQLATMALKHSRIPTIAAVSGLALGGGCEIILHCDRAVVAMESYIGLVEVGVGLIPGAGGLKEMALRAADDAKGGDVFPGIARIFEQIAMGKVSASALEARNMGYLRPSDPIIMHPQELLYVAKQQAHALYESGYTPPLQKKDIPIAGRDATATLQARMLNMLEGGFISEHDFDIGSRLATTLCGGELSPNTPVSDEWLLKLEHTHFMTLSHHAKTQARIRYMLDKGKPLRN